MTPVSSGRCFAFATKSSTTAANCAIVASPLLWIHISVPPVVPSPGIDGGLSGTTMPSRICESALYASMSTARAFCVRILADEYRSSKLLKPTKNVDELFLFWLSRMLKPSTVVMLPTAGCFMKYSDTRSDTCPVRSSDAASGMITAPSR